MTEIVIFKDAPLEKKLRSCYLIKITSMSGDEDYYDLNQVVCDTADEAALMLTIFWSYQKHQEQGTLGVSSEMEEKIRNDLILNGFTRYDKSISDLIWDYVGRDITCESVMARLTSITVSWMNDYAEEKICKFRIGYSDNFVDSFRS